MSELELRLDALRDEIAWPEMPALELSLEQVADSRARWKHKRRRLALALAVLVVLLAGVLAASPGARSAFLEIFRIRGGTVERVDQLPAIDAQRLDFGERVSRAEAERRAGFTLVAIGEPDAVYIRDRDSVVSLVYGVPERPRLVLMQLRGGVWGGFVKKVGSSRTNVEPVVVGDEPGLFVSGDAHFVMFVDGNGMVTDDRTYLASTVLLWNRGRLLLRLEGNLTRDEALELAESIGPGTAVP